MTSRRRSQLVAALAVTAVLTGSAQTAIPTPEQFFGFRMGTDNKLARWDRIVEYLKQVRADRIASVSSSSANRPTATPSSRSRSAARIR